MKKTILFFLTIGLVSAGFFAFKPNKAKRPNIVFIMSDDHAYQAISAYDTRLTQNRFEWQEGYGAFSYSQSHIDDVYKYILNQEAHHKQVTFRDEYKLLLERFQVPFEEQYILEDLI